MGYIDYIVWLNVCKCGITWLPMTTMFHCRVWHTHMSDTHVSHYLVSPTYMSLYTFFLSLPHCSEHISLPSLLFPYSLTYIISPFHMATHVSTTFHDTRFYSRLSPLQCPIHISLSRVSPTFRDKRSATFSLSSCSLIVWPTSLHLISIPRVSQSVYIVWYTSKL